MPAFDLVTIEWILVEEGSGVEATALDDSTIGDGGTWLESITEDDDVAIVVLFKLDEET